MGCHLRRIYILFASEIYNCSCLLKSRENNSKGQNSTEFIIFSFSFPTGLIQLYIAGLPLRCCWTIGGTFCSGPVPINTAQCKSVVPDSAGIGTHNLLIISHHIKCFHNPDTSLSTNAQPDVIRNPHYCSVHIYILLYIPFRKSHWPVTHTSTCETNL